MSAPHNMLESPDGEWYYPLSEDAYGLVTRAEGALSGLAELLWSMKTSPAPPPADNIGDIVGLAANALLDAINAIHSVHFNAEQ